MAYLQGIIHEQYILIIGRSGVIMSDARYIAHYNSKYSKINRAEVGSKMDEITDKLIYDLKKDIDPSESSVTGIVEPVENITEKNINNIRFYVKWYDVDSNIENYNEIENKDISDNYGDVKVSKQITEGKEKAEFTVPVKLVVTQITHNDLNTNTTNTNTIEP